jgi:hypothetical protein
VRLGATSRRVVDVKEDAESHRGILWGARSRSSGEEEDGSAAAPGLVGTTNSPPEEVREPGAGRASGPDAPERAAAIHFVSDALSDGRRFRT